MEEKVWQLHDQRLNEHEVRFNQGTRDLTEIKDVLKQLTERINEGVSKTQQKILEENKNIELEMRDLKYAVQLHTKDMNNKMDMVEENFRKRIEPLEESSRQRDKIYVWGILSGLILGIVSFGVNKMLQKITEKNQEEIQDIQHLKSVPVKH